MGGGERRPSPLIHSKAVSSTDELKRGWRIDDMQRERERMSRVYIDIKTMMMMIKYMHLKNKYKKRYL